MSLSLDDVATWLAVFVRVAAWSFAAPLIGEKMVPPRARVGLAGLVALALSTTRPTVTLAALPLVAPGEALLGLVAGFVARAVLAGAEAAGQLIGLQLELGFAQTFDPFMREESLPTRRLAYGLAALAFLATGGLESSVRALACAPLDVRSLSLILPRLVDASGHVLAVALRAAAPVLLAGVVANVAVGLASRAAPAMNVLAMMMVVVMLVGGSALVLSAPALVADLTLVARHAADAAGDLLR